MFGDFLQGPALSGGNPGIGWGKTHNFSTGTTYTLTNNLVVDANVGFVRMNANVEHTDIDQNQGTDLLGSAGYQWPERLRGRHAPLRAVRVHGAGRRFGRDALLPQRRPGAGGGQPELDQGPAQHPRRRRLLLAGAEPHPARGRARRSWRLHVRHRSHAAQRRPQRQQLQWLGDVPARPADQHRPPARGGRAVHGARQHVQRLRQGPVAGDLQADAVVRHALGVLPAADARGPRHRALRSSRPTGC